jgi:uncharacterized protein YkwD
MKIPVIALVFLAAALPALAEPRRPDVPRVEVATIEGTNEFRREHGLRPLGKNAKLEETARAFAEFMARTGEFDHDAGGTTPAQRVKTHGYDYCYVSENLSRQYSTAGFTTGDLAHKLVQGWIESPGHRSNMLAPDVVDTAVAVAYRRYKGYEDYYAVQLFARPRAESIRFVVRNAAELPVKYRVDGREFELAPRRARTHTECMPLDVAFTTSGGAGLGSFSVGTGDRFVVYPNGGEVAIRKE